MDTPWNVGGELSVTLDLQTQYAAYRVKKLRLENVSPKNEVVGVTIRPKSPKGFKIKAITVH